MRSALLLTTLLLPALTGCPDAQVAARPEAHPAVVPPESGPFAGFDRNDYPGDAALPALRERFRFLGYWITPPPGETATTWLGTRERLRSMGFGFLVLADGKLDAQILKAQKAGTTPAALGRADAATAVRTAQAEGFPAGTILFLDQEEGGRLLPEQAAYFFGWTEALAASSFRPGAYLSGQQDPDGTDPQGKALTITTAQDVREHIAKEHLHPVTLWVYQDACPPAPGCVADRPPRLQLSGTMDAPVWQYAQSPRRPTLTASCAKTYAADGNCYAAPVASLPASLKGVYLDLDAADSPDPSHGR